MRIFVNELDKNVIDENTRQTKYLLCNRKIPKKAIGTSRLRRCCAPKSLSLYAIV